MKLSDNTRKVLLEAIQEAMWNPPTAGQEPEHVLDTLVPYLESIDTNARAHGYSKALASMCEEVFEVNVANGWFDEERTFGDMIALLHSEASEALEAYRRWGLDDMTPKPTGDTGNPPKPEGVGSEFADVLVRLLDTCKRYDVDLHWEYRRKLAHNRTRGHHYGGKRL